MSSFSQLIKALFLLPLLWLSTSASALEFEAFDLQRFEALQAEGATVLVDVYAPWCPDCQKQHVVLEEYQAMYPDSGMHIMRIDFDTEKQWVTHFRAPRQATLILFSGEERVWFSVAESRRNVLFEAFNAVTQP